MPTVNVRPPALSVRRPWPWLIFNGGKDPENRVWTTSYRGDILIHSSSGWDGRAIPFAGELHARGVTGIPLHRLSGDHDLHPHKAVVGVAELHDICSAAADGGTCDCPPWAAERHHHWRLRNAAAFPRPVECRGFLGLWQVRDTVWPAVETQLKEVGRVV